MLRDYGSRYMAGSQAGLGGCSCTTVGSCPLLLAWDRNRIIVAYHSSSSSRVTSMAYRNFGHNLGHISHPIRYISSSTGLTGHQLNCAVVSLLHH